MGLIASALANGESAERVALTDSLDATYLQASIEVSRNKIESVPGENTVRGVWLFNGTYYAFRDAAGGVTGAIYSSSDLGWVLVDTGVTTSFLNGNGSGFVTGETLTGSSSMASAVIVDVVVASGDWGAGTAAGTLYLSAVNGGPFLSETATGSTTLTTAIVVTETETTLLPGGRYEFINENFYGHASRKAMFGCDGVNPGFMISANGFRQIPTGMVADSPTHVTEYKKHLFFSFSGGSIQHSAIGDPGDTWAPVLGASEIGTGDEVTGFSTLPGDTLAVFNRNRIYILYGTSSADWNLVEHSDESGAIEWTIQRIGYPVYFDDRGLMDFKAVQDFGDFTNASFSEKIRHTLNININTVLSSIRIRDKNQYRLFFSNNLFVICSFEDRKLSGFTVCEYPLTVECSASVEAVNGDEVLLFGSTDGFVYQMDKGTSFDGAEVDAFVRLAFNFINKSELNKKFFKAIFEVTTPDHIDIKFTPDFDYGETEDITRTISAASAGGVWDVVNWDEFIWGDKLISNPVAYLDGSGQNIGISLLTSHTYEAPHTLNSVTIHYSNKGLKR